MTEQVNEVLGAEGLVDSGVSGAAKSKSSVDYLFHASAEDFKKIPGSPIAYWISKPYRTVYENSKLVEDVAHSLQGMITGDNNNFLRSWFEISFLRTSIGLNSIGDVDTYNKPWIPYNKGGALRKWFGNNEHLLNWSNSGSDLTRSRTQNKSYYFKECVTWTFISSSFFAARYCPRGFVWDVAGSSAFANSAEDNYLLLGLMSSKLGTTILKISNPTLNFQVENILALPFHNNLKKIETSLVPCVKVLINQHRTDWNTYETSWDFTVNPLIQLRSENPSQNLAENYQAWWNSNQATIAEMQRLEEENNRLFIDAYGLQDELTPDVPLEEITLTVNPKYRYGGKASDDELAKRFQSDTMAELISYAVGCMFGRYSLDKEGLVLASQGETLDDYLAHIPEPLFMPDDDNVIPMIDFDGDWFEDDISERFKQFLRVSFGEANYAANLAFIEQSLVKDIRKYFLKDFYKDHVQRYKKRPIYWLFSSPQGTFNALMYLHRYRSDTVSVVLNEYLREFRTKLQARKEYFEQINISASSSQKEKTQALKTIDKINKALDEVNSYERDVLYPLAGEQIEIDLDNGVKVNYPKFGTALKKVAGLS